MTQTVIFALSIIFMLLGILYQSMIGICYQRMIQATDGISGCNNKLLKQCKEKFIQCHQLNGGVSNVGAFVDKYMNRIKFLGMTMHFMKNLSIQFMLAGVFIAGFGVCRGFISGAQILDLLPFYIICLFGIYLFLSVTSVVDIPARKQVLKSNLTDYLENHIAKRLENGLLDKENLKSSLNTQKKVDLNEETGSLDNSQKPTNTSISADDVLQLQELLKSLLI